MDAFRFRRFRGIPEINRTFRIEHGCRLLRQLLIVIGSIPIGTPLPDITSHILQTKRIAWKGTRGSDARKSVLSCITNRKLPLERVGHPFACRSEIVSPGVDRSRCSAPRGEFPLSLGGQALSGPLAVSDRVLVGNLHDGKVVFPLKAAVRAERMPPAGPRHIGPPLKVIVEDHRVVWRAENNSTCNQILGRCSGKILGLRDSLGYRDITSGRDELGKLSIGNFRLVHPESVDLDADDWAGIVHRIRTAGRQVARIQTAHRKLTPRDPDHSFGRSLWRFFCSHQGRTKGITFTSSRV